MNRYYISSTTYLHIYMQVRARALRARGVRAERGERGAAAAGTPGLPVLL